MSSVNIGGALLHRYGSRQGPPRRRKDPPSERWNHAVLAFLAGLGVLAVLVLVGWHSESSARVAVAAALTVAGMAVAHRLFAWLTAPIADGSVDGAQPALPFAPVLGSTPMQAAFTVLAVLAVVVAVVLARHWDWLPSASFINPRRGPRLYRLFR
jgi:protein-S-isoprenylcysteine O-methyltransferase Ste14